MLGPVPFTLVSTARSCGMPEKQVKGSAGECDRESGTTPLASSKDPKLEEKGKVDDSTTEQPPTVWWQVLVQILVRE